MKYQEPRIGPVGQKILVALLGGLALGLTASPQQYFRILKSIQKDWENINRRALHQAIRNLYKSKLIDAKDNDADESTILVLTQKGKYKALSYSINSMKIPSMHKWDNKWRIVIFDIPEQHKKSRDALARTLKNLGFKTLQKSVFVFPFKCVNEIDFIIEFFNLRRYTRYIIAEHIDNELHLKKMFKLL